MTGGLYLFRLYSSTFALQSNWLDFYELAEVTIFEQNFHFSRPFQKKDLWTSSIMELIDELQ